MSEPTKPDPEDPLELKRRQQAEQKADLQQKITIARLNAELAAIEKSTNSPETPSGRLEKHFAEYDFRFMAAHRIAARERETIAEKYKDNEDLRQRAEDSIASWLREVSE